MATQSLYRRYRPRRFAELKGQEHIVRALRTSVAEGREGQAYLFSGPRGTGKTTTARIMAKVLNCSNPVDGEPCCECDSCLAVEAGTSYDVHELDAASNNGVEAMRDLIEKASLGTPGRHKVYILDEVHMLSKGAEAALLKTLEEPPPHVVFVLATTDPQKMSDTIRSRTQHLQFHLLAPDTLQDHVRWVAEDAGLTVTDDAIEQVVAQGAGSPRDTLSFLELVSNSGGGAAEVIALDDFVESMIDNDPGRALKMVAHAISRGRDPRTVVEELIGFLRNGFLSLMAPELVQLPSQRIDDVTDLARRLGPAGLVRGIETLGGALVEMRQAPDPRVLLDVATVQLTAEQLGDDSGALLARIQKLERAVADGAGASSVPSAASAPSPGPATAAPVAASPPPVDPSTGRAKLGSRAGASAPSVAPAGPANEVREPGGDETTRDGAPGVGDPSTTVPDASTPAATPGAASGSAGVGDPSTNVPRETSPSAPVEKPEPEPEATVGGRIGAQDWDAVRPTLRGMARAVFSPVVFVSSEVGSVTLAAPNDAHRAKCEEHRAAVEQALTAHAGSTVTMHLVAQGGGGGGARSGGDGGGGGARRSGGTDRGDDERRGGPPPPPDESGPHPADEGGGGTASLHAVVDEPQTAAEQDAPTEPRAEPVAAEPRPAMNGRAIAEQARSNGPEPDPDAGFVPLADSLPDDDEVDLDDLVDAPPETVRTPLDRLADAFPGSELVDDVVY